MNDRKLSPRAAQSSVPADAGRVITRAGLHQLPGHVLRPGFDPAKVTPGILHFGPGNFALAHILSYVQDCLPFDPTWGVVLVSTQSNRMVSTLQNEDLTYFLVVRENTDRTVSAMCPICDVLFGPTNPQRVTDYIASADIRLITMTLSNQGYCLDAGSGVDLTHADIVHDLRTPEEPRTVYGYLAAGLAARRLMDLPLTIMSLDNVEQNSRTLKVALLQFLTQLDRGLAEWTERNVDFPITLVDRITPRTTDEFRDLIQQEVGFGNSVVIATESFRELVIEESRFAMPRWDMSGVSYVSPSASGIHWMRKFYCLNAGHQIAGICGQRLGCHYTYEAMARGAVSRLLERFHSELLAHVIEGERDYLQQYCARIRGRFADISMQDTVTRVVARTTSKVSERLLSAVELSLSAGGPVLLAPTLVTAAWLLNLGAVDEFGEAIQLDDQEAVKLQAVHRDVRLWVHAYDGTSNSEDCREAVRKFLFRISEAVGNPQFARLAHNRDFVDIFASSLLAIERTGLERAIDALLAR